KPTLDDVGGAQTMDGGGIERDVHATFLEVAGDVLPKVRELQRGASGVGKKLALFVPIAAEIQDQAADRVRRIRAIVQDRVPARVALDRLVLPKGLQQIGEGLLG